VLQTDLPVEPHPHRGHRLGGGDAVGVPLPLNELVDDGRPRRLRLIKVLETHVDDVLEIVVVLDAELEQLWIQVLI
jgi:hypothetical protein